ncbi:type I-A CRISPR-associated protein Cas5a [Acidianus ambivalens]|uniref:Type I-A CRISPR-associated protein Cas5 n=1 Tax=Acidianus ambivalens TaxID=2283 RepID=A0A6G1T7J9_ACIAM|nr:type I-A CRISPR-associated protein Cas5a [Acidianus ambivalens]MQL56598.1 type I-A CRISPR-associated protein Cas5 [Acidianus ambivalens]
MYYLLVRFRGPLFSVKRLDVYQIASAYPFIPPSTIIGSLSNEMGVLGYCKVKDCVEFTRGLVARAREVFLKSERITISPIVLKRIRGVLEENSLPENFDEISKYSDALVREYTYSYSRQVLFIVNDKVDLVKTSLFNMQRLGDSESLISVEDVREVEVEKCDKKEVNVVSDIKGHGGRYLIMPAFDERGVRRNFGVPLYFLGSHYEVGEINYDKTLCADSVVFPEGEDW